MAAFAERVAARDPASGEQQAFAGAMPRDGVQRVLRACGIKTTLRAKRGAEQCLICANTQ